MSHKTICQLFVIPASLGASLCVSAPLETPVPQAEVTTLSAAPVGKGDNANPPVQPTGIQDAPTIANTEFLEQIRESGKQQAAEADYKLAVQSANNNNKGTASELIREAAFLQPANTRYLHLASRLAFELKDYKSTEMYLFRLLAIYRAESTPDALKQITLFDELATLYRVRGQKSAERSALMEGLALKKTIFGEGHPYIIDDLYRLAALDLDSGNIGESKRHLERAFELLETSSVAIDDRDVATAFHNIGELYSATGQLGEAESAYLKALVFWNKAPEMNRQGIEMTTARLARIQAAQSSTEVVQSFTGSQGDKSLGVTPYSPGEARARM